MFTRFSVGGLDRKRTCVGAGGRLPVWARACATLLVSVAFRRAGACLLAPSERNKKSRGRKREPTFQRIV